VDNRTRYVFISYPTDPKHEKENKCCKIYISSNLKCGEGHWWRSEYPDTARGIYPYLFSDPK
jgi:hypothetical protein